MTGVGDKATLFLSTPLEQGETIQPCYSHTVQPVSIHSPRARGDVWRAQLPAGQRSFYPLPSSEGRPKFLRPSLLFPRFYPLPSSEGRLRRD